MDNNTYVPRLTLDPNGAAAAAQAVPATEEKQEEAPVEKLDIEKLSPEEQAAVREFASKIDITDTNQVLTYGAAAQKNISEFSGQALGKVRTKDLGEVGDMLTDLVTELRGLNFDEEEKKGLKGLFNKSRNRIAELKAQYDKAEVNVDQITEMLDKHWITLTKDIATMDRMYEMNQAYFKELSM